MTVFTWSTTAANNDDADSTINFKEGQAPGTLNNSARGIMAAIAKKRDDDSGNLVTAGTSTAITITTNQTYTTLTDGISVTARITTTSGATPTLNVDSTGAKNIEAPLGTSIATGALVSGQVHTFVYDSGGDAWVAQHRYGDILTSGDNPDLAAIEALAGTAGALKKTAANTWALDALTTNLTFIKDNNGTVLPTGIMGDVTVPFACTITKVQVLADQTGSAVVDIWKDSYANFPPTDSDSITASAQPTLSSASKYTDSTLTGWTTSVTADDILRFNLDSVTDITRLTIVLTVERFPAS